MNKIRNKTIELNYPIKRGENTIKLLDIRRPDRAGHLRGINTVDLVQMNADALLKMLPRVSDLTEHEAENLDPSDFFAVGMVIVSFLVPTEMDSLSA